MDYNFKEAERKWLLFWEKEGIYKFKKGKKIYSVDTPPPTLSGMMHLGHAFSYTQQDFVVRYRRMKGYSVLYPFGTDDNGLPTERMVERLKKVDSNRMRRDEFVKLCENTIKELRVNFIEDWKRVGMSCDFSNTYSTIDEHCRKTSQKSFIDLYNKKLVYRHESPSMWCVECQTAIAQAELEDEELDSFFIDLYFELENKEKIVIATTRPELLGACVCIFVHPDDKRYKNLIGKTATVPLFNQKVKIYSDKSADPNKGSGILMICSYGDRFDVDAINRLRLKPRIVFDKNGRLNDLAGIYKGLKIKEARKKIIEDLEKEELIINKKQIKHVVNVHDKCRTEIEFLASKQWFVKIMDNKKKLLDVGKKINWYPDSMRLRYEHWVKGIQWDWCISRQRHFGIPFPLWYCKKCGEVILADEKYLPLDPLIKNPKKKCKCGSNEFIGENDVMDTWMTSSMSPQIVLNWVNDKNPIKFKGMYPMSLRPQAHDIIRTWAFYTIVKGIYHHNKIPWKDIVISGHIQDSKGRKMSKSLGNAIDPHNVLDKYGADALRFMSASSKLGEDIPFQEKDLVTGQKLVVKLWNASRFCMMHLKDFKKEKIKLGLIDKWLLAKLNKIVKECSDNFDAYDYSKTKGLVESFFWHEFCDNYLEIVKDRLYNPDKRGKDKRKAAQYVLYNSLLNILKMTAPIMPFITEEIYQEDYRKFEKVNSIHLSLWPVSEKIDKKSEEMGDLFVDTISKVRQEKTKRSLSLKYNIKRLVVDKRLKEMIDDLKAVTSAEVIEFGEFMVEI